MPEHHVPPRGRITFAAAGVGWGATGTNDWPLFRVDQIWINNRLVPLQSFAQQTAHSDHRIVICDTVLVP